MSNELGMLIIDADGAIGGSTAGAGAIVQDRRGQVLALANRTLPRMTNNFTVEPDFNLHGVSTRRKT